MTARPFLYTEPPFFSMCGRTALDDGPCSVCVGRGGLKGSEIERVALGEISPDGDVKYGLTAM